MYTVLCDGAYLHSPELNDYKLIDPTLTLEANKAGRFEFTILANHPMYSTITRLKSIIEVYDDGYLLFRGRPLNDSLDIYNSHTILCVGELDYLHDTQMPPYEFTGGITAYLTSLINNHNSKVEAHKQFTLGTVTVTDPNNYIVRSNENYSNTWEEINAKLINNLGGYIVLRRVGSINYIDYLIDAPYTSSQEIELTKNILDYQQEVNVNDIATIMIPLGAKLKDEEGNELPERVTISSVNDGKEYIEHSIGIQTYGRIWSVQIWDDVNEPHVLKSRGQSSLNALIALGVNITIKAIDLSVVDDSINRFRHLEYVRVKSEPHRIDELMLIKKQTIRLDDPSQNTIELGLNIKSFTEKQLENANVISEIKADYITNQKLSEVVSPLNVQISEIIQRATQIELNLENIELYQTYFRYSANSNGSNMTVLPQADTKYIGTYSGQGESSNYLDYSWVLIKGADGIDGAKGDKGDTGLQGQKGEDGTTYYTWLKYAPNGTPTSSQMSDDPTNMTYIGLAYNKLSQNESNVPTDYTWSRMRGEDGSDGINGVDGEDGLTYYTWIKYAPNGTPTNAEISDDPDGMEYIGIAYNKPTPTESNNANDYQWAKIKGDKGDKGDVGLQGIQGTPGNDGITYYTWVKYADSPTTGMSDYPDGKKYLGIAYNKVTPTESTTYSDYTWSLIQGEQGQPGVNGTDGQTTYTWIKYAPNGTPTSSQMSDSANGMTHIGIAVNKTTATESTVPSDYTWALIKGNDGANGLDGLDGASLFMAWADDELGTNFSLTNDTLDYIGLYIGYAPQSTNPADYSWSPSGYKNEKEINEVSLRLNSVEGSIVLKADSNGNLVLVRLDTDSLLGSQFSVKADNIRLEGLTTINDNFKVLTDGSIEVNNGMFKGQISTDKHVKIATHLQFDALKPDSVVDLLEVTRNGGGGVYWGGGINSDEGLHARMYYYSFENWEDVAFRDQPSRLFISSSGDIRLAPSVENNGKIYINETPLDYKLEEVSDADGGYTKWANGNLEVWGVVNETTDANGRINIIFPQSFIAPPVVTSLIGKGVSMRILNNVEYSVSTTRATITTYNIPSNALHTNQSVSYSYKYIGRWK